MRLMQRAFEEACVTGYEQLIPAMTNHEKDRHVVAVAVRCGAQVIVTDNLKDFQKESLDPYGIVAQSSDEFLQHQYNLSPDQFIETLEKQAKGIRRDLEYLLGLLQSRVGGLTSLIKP